jgi:hypothetical protein
MDVRRTPARVGPTHGRLPIHPILGLAGVGLAMLLAACSAGGGAPSNGVVTLSSAAPGDSGAPSASGSDSQTAMLNFAECMRDHGIDMPDPVFSQDGSGGGTVNKQGQGSGANPKDEPGFAAALEACKHLLDGINRENTGKQLTAQEQQAFLNFAACMRDHGIDVPDPDFSGGGVEIGAPDSNGGGSGPKIEPDSPTFQAAETACQHFLNDAGLVGPGKGPATGPSGGSNGSASPTPSGSAATQ